MAHFDAGIKDLLVSEAIASETTAATFFATASSKEIQIFNESGKDVGTLDEVTEVKACNDGRFLISHFIKCECCQNKSPYIMQVPFGYSIKCLRSE